jgi:hypothetical protein
MKQTITAGTKPETLPQLNRIPWRAEFPSRVDGKILWGYLHDKIPACFTGMTERR